MSYSKYLRPEDFVAYTCSRAQAEIDAHIGTDNSPTWDDFAKLSYINCIIKEGHRWRPVSPLGVPHAVAEGSSGHPQRQNHERLLICTFQTTTSTAC